MKRWLNLSNLSFLLLWILLLAAANPRIHAQGQSIGQRPFHQHLPLLVKAQPSTGNIVGAVQLSTGRGVAAVTITVTDASGVRRTTSSQGLDGIFGFESIPAGRYTVRPSRDGYEFEPISRVVDVPSFDALFVNFTARELPTTTGSIIGRVVDRDGRGIQNVLITAERGVALYNTLTEGIDGIFTFDDLPAGQYRVYAMDFDHDLAPASIDVEVPSFDALFLEFAEKP